jgi:hypothetical protein
MLSSIIASLHPASVEIVFSTAFELRGVDLPFFSCTGKKLLGKKLRGIIY